MIPTQQEFVLKLNGKNTRSYSQNHQIILATTLYQGIIVAIEVLIAVT